MSGISYFTYFLSKGLSEQCPVSVILMRKLIPRRFYPGRDRVGLPLTDFRTAQFAPTFDGVDWYAFPSIIGAVRFLLGQRPTHLLLEWWTGAVLPWYLILAATARLRGASVLIEFHESQDTGETRLPLVATIVGAGRRLLIGMAQAYVVHSEYDRDKFSVEMNLTRSRIRVIEHGPYQFARSNRDDRRRSDDDHPNQILFFGTIRPYKGLEYLIPAFEDLLDEEPGRWTLHVVGETWEGWTEPSRLIERSRFRDQITFQNTYVTDEELPGIFGSADVVALPYLRSSASGPLHMTMSCGLPVVVSSVGGLTDIAGAYSGAVLVEPGDVAELKRGLRAAVELRGPFSDPSSWDAVAADMIELAGGVGSGRSAT